MSKIGRKAIPLTGVQVKINGNVVEYSGPKAKGTYELPTELKAEVEGNELRLVALQKDSDVNRIWGLHRAKLANAIAGANAPFEKQLKIVGLGYKAALSGGALQLTLGKSHKISYALDPRVTVDIDKTGQLLTFKSFDRELLGRVGSEVRAFRAPEPYKGTGIQYANETILRKAGKAKAA
jgi:large subunit ribosomal protein L6